MTGIERIITQISEDLISSVEAKPLLDKFRRLRDEAQVELDREADPLDKVDLHPTARRHYEQQLTHLAASVQDGIDLGNQAEVQALRDIVTRVTVHPNPDKRGGVILDIQGQLDPIILWEKRDPRSVGVSGGGTRNLPEKP